MGLWDAVTNLPADLVHAVFSALSGLLVAFITPLIDVAKVLITVNIDPSHFVDLWQTIVTIISCFYLLLFVIVGLKFLFGCYDAVQRADAKEWFKKAILLVLAVNGSLLLYSLVLNLSSAIALFLWNSKFESLFSVAKLGALDFIWLIIFSLFLLLALITLVLREIFLIVSVMLFPIGLFLYFIPPLKDYGSIVLNLVGVFAFMNVLDVIILIAVQLFLTEFSLSLIHISEPTRPY